MINKVEPDNNKAKGLSNSTVRALWEDLGGRVHGPNIETAVIPEADLLRFANLIWSAGGVQGKFDKETAGPAQLDLVAHLHRQKAFSEKTFGPGMRTAGICDHIRKELGEIEMDPANLMEWIDAILLALDGAWRAGHTPENIAKALALKLATNEQRAWPDWRTADPDKAIEHVRGDNVSTTSKRN